MITIYDIAQKTGYSPSTVSKALNGYSDIGSKAKEIILNKAKEMGYIPNYNAKALVTKRSWMIGILYTEDLRRGLEHPFFGGVIEGFKSRVEEDGYEIIFISRKIGNRHMSYLDHCKNRGVDAVFMTVVNDKDPDIIELINSGITCVSSDFIHPNMYSVISDNKQGTYDGMRYLLQLGHKRIAHISGPNNSIAAKERFNAYREILKEERIECDPRLVAEGEKYDNESGYIAMKKILMQNIEKPTAVYAASDSLAYGAILAVREEGYRVPEEISILGFDDIETSAYFSPPLTTLRQNKKAIGITSAEILLSILKGQEVRERNVRIPVELKIRESCVPVLIK